MVKKIVILGPESTGKSTLCEQLAIHFKTSWCPEYAREYLLQHGTNYSFDDLLTIAKGQRSLEDRFTTLVTNRDQRDGFETTPSLLFIDTDQYVMKTWCEFVFNRCHNWILNEVACRPYDLYLLCNIDLPWIKDELREYPDEKPRIALYHMYRDLMINQNIPWVDVSGDYHQRFTIAVQAIEEMIYQSKNDG